MEAEKADRERGRAGRRIQDNSTLRQPKSKGNPPGKGGGIRPEEAEPQDTKGKSAEAKRDNPTNRA